MPGLACMEVMVPGEGDDDGFGLDFGGDDVGLVGVVVLGERRLLPLASVGDIEPRSSPEPGLV